MIIYRFKIICAVRHALRTVNIKALLLHALRRTVVIKYMSLHICKVLLYYYYILFVHIGNNFHCHCHCHYNQIIH